MATVRPDLQRAARETRVERLSRRLAAPPLVTLTDIRKRWDKRGPAVLDGVDLALYAGTIVSLVGANGAGKTTLLRIAAGLITPDAGEVQIDGLHPRRHRRDFQRRLGFVSAGSGGLYARFSARQHLAYWARLAFVPESERAAACERVSEQFELADFASRRVDRLSMGQRQRVRLALAFLHEPKVVLLDEPWNSLDDDGVEMVTRALLEFRARGGTALCCSPSSEHVKEHVEQAYVLENGRLHER